MIMKENEERTSSTSVLPMNKTGEGKIFVIAFVITTAICLMVGILANILPFFM